MSTVDNAVSTIQDRLSQGITDWDVGNEDLTDINGVLSELSNNDLNEVISKLSDDNLKNWVQEIHGVRGELSASQRQDLFRTLAEGQLSPEQTTRLIEAFDAEGNEDSIREIGTAVASYGTPESKQAFVEAMAARTTSGESDYDPAATHKNDVTDKLLADPDAQAVAEVLGSLQGSAFDDAVKALDASQLDAVMQAGIYQAETSSRNGTITNFDSTVAARIVEAAASSSDPELKARVFDSAGEHLVKIQGGGDNGAVPGGIGVDSRLEGARTELADAMHRLLDSDPNGIVTALRVGPEADPSGAALTALNAELISAGREGDVRDIILKLQQGNVGTQNAFETVKNNEVVARNLGYFTGTSVNAISALNIEHGEAVDALKDIFGVAYGAAGAANPAAGVLASVGNGLTANAIDEIIGDFETSEGSAQDLANAFYKLSIPRDGEGRIDDGENSTIQDLKTEFGAVTGLDVDD